MGAEALDQSRDAAAANLPALAPLAPAPPESPAPVSSPSLATADGSSIIDDSESGIAAMPSQTPSTAPSPSSPTGPQPLVSLVVRVYTKTDEIFRLLDGLRTQTLPPAEIVLIDSGSADWVVAGLEKLAAEGLAVTGSPVPAAVQLIKIPNTQYQSARALNDAVARASHELVAIISQDAIPADEHYLEALTRGFEDPTMAGTYGRQVIDEGPPDPLGEKDLVKTYPPESRTQSYPECWFVNTCSMVRRSLWAEHHFDEGAMISEDHEWALWAQRKGLRVRYEAAAVVLHHHRYKSLRDVWNRHFQEGLGLAYIHRTRLNSVRVAARWAREAVSDATWLAGRCELKHWPRGAAVRAVKHAALWAGHRQAPLPDVGPDNEPEMPPDVVMRLTEVWRLFRLWKRRPSSLKDRFVQAVARRKHHEPLYDEFWAVRGVSFSVRRGEVIGVCGSNGSGKSTLLKVIARIAPATHGTVTIRGRVAPLLEVGTGFHPELSGRENIALNAAILGLSRAEVEARHGSIVEFAELGEFIDCPVKTYSAGMLMRLGFSVLTHVEADILLIDEVLGVGDAQFQAKCSSWMRRLRRDGVTTIVVSHDLQTMASLCDRILWMDRGRLVADGPPADVLPRYNPGFVMPATAASDAQG